MIRMKSLLMEQAELPDFEAATEYVLQNPLPKPKPVIDSEDDATETEEEEDATETEEEDLAWTEYELVDYTMLMKYVKYVANLLDGWVTQGNYTKVYFALKKYAYDADKEIRKVVLYREKYYDALQFLAWSYAITEKGDSLYDDIQNIGTNTYDTSFIQNRVVDMKQLIQPEIYKIEGISTTKPQPLNITADEVRRDAGGEW